MTLTDGPFATISQFTPMYGLASIARAPLTGQGFSISAVANLTVWCW